MPKLTPQFVFDEGTSTVVEQITSVQEVRHDVMEARIQLVQALQDKDAIAAKIIRLEAIIAAAPKVVKGKNA